MKPALIKLVDAILRHMEEHPETAPTEYGIRKWLAQQGCTKRDIESAMRILRPRFSATSAGAVENPVSTRPLTDTELYKLAPQARDMLARLDAYGLIDPYEREMILERLNHFEGEIGLEELDFLLSWVVYSTRDFETQQTFNRVIESREEQFN